MQQANYLTVADLASRWKLSESTIRRKIREGDLPVIRIGRAIRIEQVEVEQQEQRWKVIQTNEDTRDLTALAQADTADFEDWNTVKARNGL